MYGGEVSVLVSPLVAPNKAHKLKMQQDHPINGRLRTEATTILNVNTHQKKPPRPWEIRWYTKRRNT